MACGLLGSFWFGSFKIHFSKSFEEIHVILLYRDHISLNNSPGMVLLCIFVSVFLDSNKVAVRPLKSSWTPVCCAALSCSVISAFL